MMNWHHVMRWSMNVMFVSCMCVVLVWIAQVASVDKKARLAAADGGIGTIPVRRRMAMGMVV